MAPLSLPPSCSNLMNIYYFHIRDDHGIIEDADGIELPNLRALLEEVFRSMDEFLQDAATLRTMRFEIADANGRTVLVMPLRERAAHRMALSDLSNGPDQVH